MDKLEKPPAINGHGGARDGAGRKPFEPTAKERQQVEAMAGVGLPHDQIGALVRDGVCTDVIRQYFAKELKAGKAKASAKIGQTLFNRAIGGETAALIWWTKSQMGWKEKRELDVTSSDGTMSPSAPAVATEVLTKLNQAHGD